MILNCLQRMFPIFFLFFCLWTRGSCWINTFGFSIDRLMKSKCFFCLFKDKDQYLNLYQMIKVTLWSENHTWTCSKTLYWMPSQFSDKPFKRIFVHNNIKWHSEYMFSKNLSVFQSISELSFLSILCFFCFKIFSIQYYVDLSIF